ncbi:MAG TPA: signal peptidase I [Candidatus Baltobacteraceae bacterium]|nr:signal peptidase I [Candidatus Baltobacteraceae bacterium]
MENTPKPDAQETLPTPAPAPQGESPADDAGEPSLLGSIGRFALELVEIVVISLAIILPIRYFLIQPFYVKGASMEPTFDDHEYLIIDELSYRFRPPQRGEVVVFRYPLDPRQYFIKRIVGLPGEKIRVSDSKIVIVNAEHPDGFALDESPYLSPEVFTHGDKTVELGPEEYYVMGDNRTASLDSRTFGPLPAKNIVGRVWIRGWPLDRAAVFSAP